MVGPGANIRTLAKPGVPQTIYRFGQEDPVDDRYWFHWTTDVDVCRGQIAGDVSEWTYFTGDGNPKATYSSIALGADYRYPLVTRPLGLPAPTGAANAAANAFTPAPHAAEVTLSAPLIAELSTEHGLQISTTTDEDSAYTTVALGAPISAESVKTAINSSSLATSLTATVVGDYVTLKTTAKGPAVKLYVKAQTGTEPDLDGAFTKDANRLTDTGATNTDAYIVILGSEIGSISMGDRIAIETVALETTQQYAVGFTEVTTATTTPEALVTLINSNAGGRVRATKYGSCVVVTPGTLGSGPGDLIRYHRAVPRTPEDIAKQRANGNSNPETLRILKAIQTNGSEQAAPARVFITQTDVDAMQDRFLWALVNSDEHEVAISSEAHVDEVAQLNAGYNVSVQTFGAIEPFAVVETDAVGPMASLTIGSGDYPDKATYSRLTAEGYEDTDTTKESRAYAYTWVNKESGFDFESAPSPPSNVVDTRFEQGVSLSGMDPVPGGQYVVTHRRIYRSVNGVYLFVKEIPASKTSFEDDVLSPALGEQLPSLTWVGPPAELRGLTNLPNGLMAGFVGRDVYFCDPYHPHAWPEQYIQSLDYPVVGLAAMDTTLAVLTTGVPYFMQGSHPGSMTSVKSDLRQACVSKRSIVQIGDTVLYAAPDGLMSLSPQGSSIITLNMFDQEQWRDLFNPESIHAYTHDNQYIAFYKRGDADGEKGGFVYDIRTSEFTTHDVYATAGFQDVQTDKLYVAFDNRELKLWEHGTAKPYTWKSKLFTAAHPTSFSVAQVQAESYGSITFKLYVDGVLLHTQVVTSREPFRLPPKRGIDFEFSLAGNVDVFSVSIAHSMTELAGV